MQWILIHSGIQSQSCIYIHRQYVRTALNGGTIARHIDYDIFWPTISINAFSGGGGGGGGGWDNTWMGSGYVIDIDYIGDSNIIIRDRKMTTSSTISYLGLDYNMQQLKHKC